MIAGDIALEHKIRHERLYSFAEKGISNKR